MSPSTNARDVVRPQTFAVAFAVVVSGPYAVTLDVSFRWSAESDYNIWHLHSLSIDESQSNV